MHMDIIMPPPPKVAEVEDSSATETGVSEIDTFLMDERRRMMLKMIMINRNEFRTLFGITFANQWGHFTDHWMSRIIHAYSDWIEYPKGYRVLKGHFKTVTSLVFSNDGCFLFTGSDDETILKWNAVNHSLKSRWTAHDGGVKCLVYSADLLVSGGTDNTIKVWNPFTCALKRCLEGHTSWVTALSVNAKGTRILSGSLDKSIRLWSVENGECLSVLGYHTMAVKSVLFMDECSVLIGSLGGSIKKWTISMESSMAESVWESAMQKDILGLDGFFFISCDGSLLACPHQSGLSILDWPKMDIVYQFKFRVRIGVFHPLIAHWMAVSDLWMNTIDIYDIRNGKSLWHAKSNRTSIVDLCFTPDGTRLVSSCRTHVISVWDTHEL